MDPATVVMMLLLGAVLGFFVGGWLGYLLCEHDVRCNRHAKFKPRDFRG